MDEECKALVGPEGRQQGESCAAAASSLRAGQLFRRAHDLAAALYGAHLSLEEAGKKGRRLSAVCAMLGVGDEEQDERRSSRTELAARVVRRQTIRAAERSRVQEGQGTAGGWQSVDL